MKQMKYQVKKKFYFFFNNFFIIFLTVEEGISILCDLGFTDKEENRYLLEKKDISSLVDKSIQMTPLHNHLLNREMLLYRSLYIEEKKIKNCSLDKASLKFKPEMRIIKYLVENKSDINYLDHYKRTVLHYATSNEIVTLEIVKYLIERKCEINIQNSTGNSPLHNTSKKNFFFCLIYYFNLFFSIYFIIIFFWTGSFKINPKIAIYLIESKCELNSVDEEMWTPLHLLCRYNLRQEVIEKMVEYKVNLEAKNKNGWTPLLLSSRYSFSRYIMLANKLRLDDGSVVNICKFNQSSKHCIIW